jgi:ribosomal protein L11 methyltransferase
MYQLEVTLKERPSPSTWDTVSGVLFQNDCRGVDEGEEPAPEGQRALVAADEFRSALEPNVMAGPLRFSAYFDDELNAQLALECLEKLTELNITSSHIQVAEVCDYTDLYRKSFNPIIISPHWVVRAPWQTVEPQVAELELIVEPGMAFGTGSHHTTRTCLSALAMPGVRGMLCEPGATGLDFGCGSGILAIAMKKLGASHVIGVDIDELAVKSTQQNAMLNSVSVESEVQEPAEHAQFNVVVANILLTTLLEYLVKLKNWTRPGGFLILSGLLKGQELTIIQAVKDPFWIHVESLESATGPDDAWITLVLQRSMDKKS